MCILTFIRSFNLSMHSKSIVMLPHTNRGITVGLEFPQRNTCFCSFLRVCTEQSAANLSVEDYFRERPGTFQHSTAALTHKPFNCFIILNRREQTNQ